MNRFTPQIGSACERLLSHEARENVTQAVKTSAAFLVCEKLRPPLASLMGHVGFCSLLSRALVLTHTESLWSGTVQVKADGTLEGWDKLEGQISPKQFAEGSKVLIARLLSLLVAFIGEELTFRLLREIWPEVALNTDSMMTEENE